MKYRRLGRAGWMVSEIGYGMWGMAAWTGSSDAESQLSLQRAVELGCNFFDTAWHYGSGHSEHLLGEVVRRNPGKKLFVATKIPPKNLTWPARPEFTLDDCYPSEHIDRYVHISLKNLGLETIDLIHFHTWSDAWLEDDRWVKKIDELRRKGLFRAVGISLNRWEPWNGVRAVRSGLIDAVQVMYNIFDQNPEDELFPACAAMDVGVIARCPLDQGALSGTLTLESKWPEGDWRSTHFTPERLKEFVSHADALKPLVPRGMTLPEMALRFILNNPDVSTLIPGMRKAKNVEANLLAGEQGPLPVDLYTELRKHRWDRESIRRPK
jgi:aryl-alcohol dehydrogenase-like predicted oxidoreductase